MTKQKPRFDVTTLGEVMLRLSVPAGERLETAARFHVFPAGAEANLVGALARLGRRCAWVGGLPATSLGRLAASHLRLAGVDLEGVVWCDDGRLGLYFVEMAAPPRPIQVIYDRADACAARLRPEQVPWEYLLDTRLLHLTGITPALSPGCQALVQEAVGRARTAGIPVAFDVNYRRKLWDEATAAAVLAPYLAGAALLFCAQADAGRLFGCTGTPEQVARAMAALSRAAVTVITAGDQGVVAWDGQRLWQEPARPVQVLDRLGAGDALAAGVIDGWLAGNLALGLRQGTLLAALALSQQGDMVVTTPEEVAALLADPSASVSR